MRTSLSLLLATSLYLFPLPASSFECTNAGAGSTSPDDSGIGTRTACGDGAISSGPNSTALGGAAVSGGNDSTALGRSAISNGDDSAALGTGASSAGNFSTALGKGANSAGTSSTAVGEGASSAGFSSTALGSDADSAGTSSTAVGEGASSPGERSTALGRGASSAGERSIALGRNANSFEASSTAVGADTSATGIDSTALGRGASSAGDFSTTLGFFSRSPGDNSTAVGFRATAPNDNTLVLGSIRGENSASSYVDVAIGTTDPLAPLHIFRDDLTQELLLLESNEAGGAQDRAMIQLINNGGIRFQFNNPALGTAWRFQAATRAQDNFEIAKVGTGEIEFRVDASGNAFLTGMLFENSDRHAKTNIDTINPDEVLAKLAELPISEWEYKDTPGQRHVGPMAQDFREAFGLGANDTSLASIDTSGVALVAIKALDAQNRALEAKSRALEAEVKNLSALKDQNRALESMVQQLAANNREQESRLAKLETAGQELADLRALLTRTLPQVAQH